MNEMVEKPWLSHYDAGVPIHIEYPDICLHEMFFSVAEKFPTKTCIFYEGSERKYQEIKDDICAVATALIKRGVKPGQRIGLILPNVPEFVIAYYAILSIGAVVVPLNTAYTVSELEYEIKKTQICLLFGWEQKIELLRELKYRCELSHVIICDGNYFSKNSVGKRNQKNSTELRFEELTTKENNGIMLPKVDQKMAALFQFSGGTTGTPKAAVALHKNILANVYQFRQWLTTLNDGNEQFLTVIPLSHVYGMVIGLNVGIAMGAAINLISDPRNTQKILETIEKRKISFYPGVPTMYHSINQNEDVKKGKYDLRSIKACISGSAPLIPEIRRQFEKLTGGKLVEGYGLSEAPTATHCNPILGENRNGSIGLPLPDVECMIDRSTEYSTDTGELLVKGPQVMSHYHEEDEETDKVFENGWLRTGDIARMDNDGYFYLTGRKKELIKVGGLQVWPDEVEQALMKNPEIREVAVAGIPDEAKGERVKAWVVIKEGRSISPEKIRENCADEIARFKVPTRIEFVDEIPKSPVGKVLRRELVKREIENKYRE